MKSQLIGHLQYILSYVFSFGFLEISSPISRITMYFTLKHMPYIILIQYVYLYMCCKSYGGIMGHNFPTQTIYP